MTKKKFMQKLDKYIKDLPYDEKASVFMFYEEYFKDLGLGDDDEIPDDINPKKIASDILLEYGVIKKGNGFSSFKLFLITLGGIFSLPITIPMLILVFTGIVVAGALLISLFALIFSILTVPFYLGFSLIGTILSNIGNNLSTIDTLASVLIISGVILILYSIIKGIVKIFFKILLMMTSTIYSWIYNKNEMKYEDINMELKKLDKIDLNNFVGKIKIIKGNENRLKILNSNIESIVKYDEEKGELIVSQIGKVFFSEKYKSILELEYSEESLDVNIKNVVARFKMETPEIGDIEIKNIVGKFYFILFDDINLDKSNILGNVKIKNNISISPESKLNMSIFNVVGKVVIGDGKDA